MMTESQLQDRVRLILGADPACVFWRNNVGLAEMRGYKVRFGLAEGSADLIGLFRGRFIAVEIKTPTGRQSPAQRQWQGVVELHQGLYYLVRSEDDARALLQDLHQRFPC